MINYQQFCEMTQTFVQTLRHTEEVFDELDHMFGQKAENNGEICGYYKLIDVIEKFNDTFFSKSDNLYIYFFESGNYKKFYSESWNWEVESPTDTNTIIINNALEFYNLIAEIEKN